MVREQAMINFLDEVEKTKKKEKDIKKFTESVDFKFKKIKEVKEDAREICLDKLISDIYKNAVPIDNDVKDVLADDLDDEFVQFLKAKQPKGTTFYVKEAIKKGSKPAKILMESVNKFLDDYFKEYALNINETSVDEIDFNIDDPDVEDKLKEISTNMELDELSECIKDNVKIATNNEIKRVKDEQQKIKDIEDSMKNDENITTESAYEKALVLKGVKSPSSKLYQPTLFEGIMINKMNLVKESGADLDPAIQHKLAFMESVKEYTKLSVLNSLMLESYNGVSAKKLANNYATMKETGEINMLRNDRVVMLNDFVATEGANLDARKKFKETKKTYKEQMAKAKGYIKAKEYDKAIKVLEQSKKTVHKSYDEMIEDGSTIGSVLFSFITGSFPFFLRDLIACVLSPLAFGIPSIVNNIKKLIERVNVVIKDWDKKDAKQVEMEDVNLYKNALKVRLNEYDKLLDKTIESVRAAKKANK